MFADLGLELVLCDERQEIVRKTCKLIRFHRLIVICALRQLSFELWDQLEQPAADKVNAFRLDVSSDAQILTSFKETSAHVDTQIVCLVIVGLQNQSLDVVLRLRALRRCLFCAMSTTFLGRHITVSINAISLTFDLDRWLLGHVKFSHHLCDCGSVTAMAEQRVS